MVPYSQIRRTGSGGVARAQGVTWTDRPSSAGVDFSNMMQLVDSVRSMQFEHAGGPRCQACPTRWERTGSRRAGLRPARRPSRRDEPAVEAGLNRSGAGDEGDPGCEGEGSMIRRGPSASSQHGPRGVEAARTTSPLPAQMRTRARGPRARARADLGEQRARRSARLELGLRARAARQSHQNGTHFRHATRDTTNRGGVSAGAAAMEARKLGCGAQEDVELRPGRERRVEHALA